MRHRLRSVLRLTVLCLLCFCLLPAAGAAGDVTLTAVNDSFLPLSDSTMPTRRGGTQYVPYSVFTGSLGISGSYNSSSETLLLSSGGSSLSFDLSAGTVYDENMNSYSTPAYWINGTVYVPVKLVCGRFGLSYSNISAAAPILRICSDAAVQSDSAFVSSTTATVRSMLDAYHGSGGSTSTPSTDPETPPTQTDPITGQPIEPVTLKPSAVYLTYLGVPNTNTTDILDSLETSGIHATFFLTADGTPLESDLLRQIVGRGHAVGFLLRSDTQDMTTHLQQANALLWNATGCTSRLVCISDGSGNLSAAQRSGLIAAGYRIWDASFDSEDHSRTAAQSAARVTAALTQTTSPVVIRMGQYASTAQTTDAICAYLRTNAITTLTASTTRTPLNAIGETR